MLFQSFKKIKNVVLIDDREVEGLRNKKSNRVEFLVG
jgi:hypothetical protein